MTDLFVDQLLLDIDSLIHFLPRLAFAFVVLFLFYIIGKLLGAGLRKIAGRASLREEVLSYLSKLLTGIVTFIGFIFSLNVLGFTAFATTLLAGGGLTAVMLGFAFKDIGENFLAGFLLAFNRPFNKGDLIESGGITGRVQQIDLRHTHIRTGDGCDVFVPSSQLFTRPLHNYTIDGLRRGSFTVGIDYGNDPQRAIQIINEVMQNTKKVLKKPAFSTQIKGFEADYVELQVSFWINVRDQESGLPAIRTEVMKGVREALIQEQFTFSADVSTALDVRPVRVSVDR
ncbi:MAG: mechanosensitive ion channel family protein [Cyclonatronaceae bacterium]